MPRINIREYYKKDVKELTPTEFEDCCLKILSGYAEEEQLREFVIKHNKIMKTHDGNYQVDIYVEFIVLNDSKIRVLVECKQHKNPVKRETVELLYNRLQSTGCNKGILMATAHFQKGAVNFAESHGISLVEVQNTCDLFCSYADGSDFTLPFEQEVFHRYPVFYADIVTSEKKTIFPTSSMIQRYIDEINEEQKVR